MISCLQHLPFFPSQAWVIDPKRIPSWRHEVLKAGEDDVRWKVVTIKTRDETTGDFTIDSDDPDKKHLERTFIVDTITGELYRLENPCLVRTKCVEITLFCAGYALLMVTANSIKTIMNVTLVAAKAFSELGCRLLAGEISSAFYEAGRVAWNGMCKEIWPDLFRVVASPLFWLGMELGAIIGVFYDPYEGRKIVSHVENAWHGYVNYRNDPRWIANSEDRLVRPHEVFTGVCFMAWCFQVRGDLNERIQNGAIKHEVIRSEDIQPIWGYISSF